MRICITTPSFAVHGGIRNILEWANRLTQWHQVSIYNPHPVSVCTWFVINKSVRIIRKESDISDHDLLIITSPHAIALQKLKKPAKKIIYQQMMEHLFRPHDSSWFKQCIEFYTSPYPIITAAEWNKKEMKDIFKRKGKTIVMGQGVNTDDFPISRKKKDGRTVLIEGWECTNPAKDIDYIAPRVAMCLRSEGYRILAYSALPLTHFKEVPHEYYQKPALKKMNELYERATILIKASRYDDHALSPMEAMTKGTLTARAIIKGDDDLLDGINCLRSGYEEDQLLFNARRLLTTPQLRNMLAAKCYEQTEMFTWDYWMNKINKILISQ